MDKIYDKKNKPIIVLMILLILFILSINGYLNNIMNRICYDFDNRTEKYLKDTTIKAATAYTMARGINALVSIIQDTEVSIVVADIAIGEALDPVNDIVEKFSNILMYSTVSLALQLFIFKLSKEIGFHYLILFSLLCYITGKVLCLIGGRDCVKFQYYGKILFFSAIFIRLIIPSIVFIGINTEMFYKEKYENANKNLDRIKTEQDDFWKNSSETDKMSKWNIKKNLEKIKTKIEYKINELKNISEHILNLIIVFLMQTIILPILFFFVFKYVFKLIVSDKHFSIEKNIKELYENK